MQHQEIPRVNSKDTARLQELAAKHNETGMPFFIRDDELAAAVEGMSLPDMSGFLRLFGKVGEGYATNFHLARPSVLQEKVHQLICDRMGLAPRSSYQGERIRYSHNLKGKEFHAGPGFNYKILLMLNGTKQWEVIDPKYTNQLKPTEEGKCGLRIAINDADDFELKFGKDDASKNGIQYMSGVQYTGDILVLSSQWWHCTHNHTPSTSMLGNKYKNTKIFNEVIHARELVCKINSGENGVRNCMKSRSNDLGSMKWSCGFFEESSAPAAKPVEQVLSEGHQ
jgi:hypothetical protein